MSNLVTIPDLPSGTITLTTLLEGSNNPGSIKILISDLSEFYQLLAEKNAANGYAGLDGSAKLPASTLPSTVVLTDQANFYSAGVTQDFGASNIIDVSGLAIGTSTLGSVDLLIQNSSTAKFRMVGNSGNVQHDISSEFGLIYNRTISGPAIMDIKGLPADNVSAAVYRFGRDSGSSGNNAIQLFENNDTSVQTELTSSGGNTFLNAIGGNVGIGDITPSFKLDVAGTIRATGSLLITDISTANSYVIQTSDITTERDITLPLLTANDIFVFEAFAQTLTNKTITAAANTLTIASTDLTDTDNIAYLNTANSFGVGLKQSFQASTGVAGININGQVPSSVAAGDIFRDDDELQYGDSTPTTQTIVTATLTQTLTNKTLTQPAIGNFTSATHDHAAAAGGAQLLSTDALSDTANIAYLNTANTYSAVLQNFAAADMRIPASASPSMSAEGDFALDTSVGSFTAGILVYRDDTEQLGVVAMPIAQFTEPADGDIISYNTTTNDFELGQPVSQEVFTWSNNHSMASFKLTASASKDVILNAPTGQAVSFEVNGTEKYEFNATQADFKGNSINNLAILTSNATNPAVAGTIRLGNAEKIVWRNAINDDDGLVFELDSNDVASLSVLTRSYEFSEALLTLDGADLRNVGSIGIGSNADPAPRELVIDASGEGEIANFRMIGEEGNVTQNMGTEFDWVYNRTSDGAAIIDIQAKPLAGTNRNAIIRFGLQSGSTALNNTLFFDSNGNKMQTQLGSSNSITYFNRRGGFTSIGKQLPEFQLDVNGDIRTTDDFIMDSGGVKATGTVTIDSPVANTFATGTATFSGVAIGNALVINGLAYTAVSSKVDNSQFELGSSDSDAAENCADSINADTRTGTTGDVSAVSEAEVITITTDVSGVAGNAILLSETGDGITVSDTTLTEGVDADTVTLYDNLLYTAVNGAKADNTEFQVDMGTNTATAEKLVESINGDGRAGQGAGAVAINVIASSAIAVVTLTASVTGTDGNSILLASSSSSTLLTSGSTLGAGAGTLGVNALQLSIASGSLDVNRTVSFPNLTANDTFVLANVSQTLTNKTLDVATNTITGLTLATVAAANKVVGASTDLTDSSNLARDSNNLSFFSSTTSAQLSGVISDETGTGALVFGTSPTIATPVIGTIVDANANEIAEFTSPGSSAVNFISFGSSNTLVDPTIGAGGSDTNVNLNISGQGTGVVNIDSTLFLTFEMNANDNPINNLEDPTLAQDAVTKIYDDSANGFAGKEPARLASTADVDLLTAALQDVDGISGGSNYIEGETVDLTAVSGSGATGTVTVSGTAVTSVTIVIGGFGYVDDEAITISSNLSGSGATGDAVVGVNTIVIDGVSVVTGDRVLLKDQLVLSENGIYDVGVITDADLWTRSADIDTADEFTNASVFVKEGTANVDRTFFQTQIVSTVNTDAVIFKRASIPVDIKNGVDAVDVNGTTNVVFLQAFSSAPNVTVSFTNDTDYTGGSKGVALSVYAITTTGFTIRYDDDLGGAADPATFQWIATNAGNPS